MKRTLWFLMLTLPSLCLTGCATKALWDEGNFVRFYEPADAPNVSLFRASRGSDVLVEYDETREDSDAIHRRAYWLEKNLERISAGQRPQFTRESDSRGLETIPFCETNPESAGQLEATGYAVLSKDQKAFTLHLPGNKSEEYRLPVYRDATGRAKQVFLTPAAVTADATIVGGVAAYYMLPAFWTSLNCISH